ncbi:MAG: RNA polymerase sigma factor [Candidatus Pacebacteria bacterium]|nr:RNA polymerase sigma factor [Candidatus Paceibacterota bacterium]
MATPSYTAEQEQFLAAYEEYSDIIFRFCVLKVSNREIAIDLMQDTFTKTWEYVAKGERVDNWKAFLFRSANNAIIDYYRRKKSTSLDALTEDSGYVPVSEDMDAEEAAQVAEAHRALVHLPEEFREVVSLRFVDGLQPKEIADLLGLSTNIVSVRIHRGVEKLREYMIGKKTV